MSMTRSNIQLKRVAAIQSGSTTFDPGQPCKYGHDSPRYTRSGQCVTCSKATSRKAYWNMMALLPASVHASKPVVAPKPKPKPKLKPVAQSFDQWWPEVKNSPAYAGIDCERELEKMKVWLTTAKGKHRTLNKGFVVNWLNKIDAPVNAGSGEPCTARVRNQDGTRYVPCSKPSIRKQGMGFLCVDCDRDYQERKAKTEGQS